MRSVIDERTIARAAEMLLRAAPGSKVILFGSHARGQAGPDSDLDFVVVEPRVTSRREEAVRLRDVLRPLRIPVDILVISEETFRTWSDTPGTVVYEAAHEGRVFDAVEAIR
jgi:predicted nucleotidyltransferase